MLLALKLTLRKVFKRPAALVLTVFCITIGFLSVLFIGEWIRHELSYDRFHEEHEDIYRLNIEYLDPETGHHSHFARSWLNWLRHVREDIPGISELVRLSRWNNGIVSLEKESEAFPVDLFYTDPSFFNVFTAVFIEGSAGNALADPYSMVITRKEAIRIFGTMDVIGETLYLYCNRCLEKKEYTIRAVIESFPENSHFHFDLLASYEDPENTGWAYYYLKLNKQSSPDDILEAFHDFASVYINDTEIGKLTPHLQRLTRIHLYSDLDRELEINGKIINVRLFSLLGIFILIISLFNYLNISNLNFLRNYRQDRVLMAIGAGRRALSGLHLLGNLWFIILSLISVLVLYLWLRPEFESVMGSEYQNRPGLSFYLPVTGMLIILFMAAGFYPYLAKQWFPSLFNRQYEKNWRWDLRYEGFRQFRFSGFLVFLQYLASMVLISLAMVSYRQLQLLDERGLGDRREEVLCIEDMPVQVVDKYLLFKSDLLANPLIRDVTASFEMPGDENMDAFFFEGSGVPPESEGLRLYVYPADDNYFDFYNLDIIAGSNFPSYSGNDSLPESYILNEKAIEFLNWSAEDAVGRDFSLKFELQGKNLFNGGKITGVVENFQPSSAKNEIKPYVFFQKSFWLFSSQIRLIPGERKEGTEFVKTTWDNYFPAYPLRYVFLDDHYKTLYFNELRFRKLSLILALTGLLLSALGLWSLSAVYFRNRYREIAIRRVLGASRSGILWRLMKIPLILTGMAIIPGIFASVGFSRLWLSNFANRVDLNAWMLILPALFLLLTGLTSTLQNAWKACRIRPSVYLKDE